VNAMMLFNMLAMPCAGRWGNGVPLAPVEFGRNEAASRAEVEARSFGLACLREDRVVFGGDIGRIH
jgi:hypothetical protein